MGCTMSYKNQDIVDVSMTAIPNYVTCIFGTSINHIELIPSGGDSCDEIYEKLMGVYKNDPRFSVLSHSIDGRIKKYMLNMFDKNNGIMVTKHTDHIDIDKERISDIIPYISADSMIKNESFGDLPDLSMHKDYRDRVMNIGIDLTVNH